ncbi:MAG TPA: hypothetical protein VN633_17025 [Bryobacteraceae bacterium]|nr:hypothetical protein [Bryobacteraceae bacterium]
MKPDLPKADPQQFNYEGNDSRHNLHADVDLRDRFAMAALQGFLGNTNTRIDTWGDQSCDEIRRHHATAAYLYADAMLDARKK